MPLKMTRAWRRNIEVSGSLSFFLHSTCADREGINDEWFRSISLGHPCVGFILSFSERNSPPRGIASCRPEGTASSVRP
jgi:hypothetical protein